ncbi:MAG: YggS family pyridoxal phosphate-dependent enzyme [Alphaproteobacteria bacterium]
MTIAHRLADITEKVKKSRADSMLHATPQLMGVSKGQAVAAIEDAIALGITRFGENRVQEAYEKWPAIKQKHPNLQLHLIGPLQTNKVKQALELFDVLQTLDRPKLAEEIAKYFAVHQPLATSHFFIQINTGEEPQKAGIFPKEADNFIRYCRDDLKLPVIGLMCIPPVEDVAAPHFALLREIAKRNDLKELSMGMSDDFETAIRMGATCIRLGRALFGER